MNHPNLVFVNSMWFFKLFLKHGIPLNSILWTMLEYGLLKSIWLWVRAIKVAMLKVEVPCPQGQLQPRKMSLCIMVVVGNGVKEEDTSQHFRFFCSWCLLPLFLHYQNNCFHLHACFTQAQPNEPYLSCSLLNARLMLIDISPYLSSWNIG